MKSLTHSMAQPWEQNMVGILSVSSQIASWIFKGLTLHNTE